VVLSLRSPHLSHNIPLPTDRNVTTMLEFLVVCFCYEFRSTSEPFPKGAGPALRSKLPSAQYKTGAISPEKRRPECGADCSLPHNAEVKNAWSHTSAPTYTLLACTGTNLPLRLSACDAEMVRVFFTICGSLNDVFAKSCYDVWSSVKNELQGNGQCLI